MKMLKAYKIPLSITILLLGVFVVFQNATYIKGPPGVYLLSSNHHFELTGVSGAQASITYPDFFDLTTQNVLKVKVTAKPAASLKVPGYTNFVIPYDCMQVNVTVNGVTQESKLLRVEGLSQPSTSPCYQGETSQTLDFSTALTESSLGSLDITVSHPSYDNCRMYNSAGNYGCPVSPIYRTHRVTGLLEATLSYKVPVCEAIGSGVSIAKTSKYSSAVDCLNDANFTSGNICSNIKNNPSQFSSKNWQVNFNGSNVFFGTCK